VFERLQYNNKTPQRADPLPRQAYGFSTPSRTRPRRYMALPYLGLKRVTVLTTAGTCSASEAVINGLRGVDVEGEHHRRPDLRQAVRLHPGDNCGTTYFSIEFRA
jgi:carboxyl-terminal processing protease